MGISFYSERPFFGLGVFLLELQNFLFYLHFFAISYIFGYFFTDFLQISEDRFYFSADFSKKKYFYCDFVFLQTDFYFSADFSKKEFNFRVETCRLSY